MVRHGSSWFVMVHYHGSSWFVMVHCHGSLSWFVMVHCHGSLSWFVMVHCHGSSWFTVMVRHGSLSWFVMVRHGSLSWFVMVHCHGSSWFIMVHCHGSSWFVMVRHGSLSWFHHGLSWFMMCYSLKFSRRRSCDPLFSQSGSQIHYQISFLMRLLIFPFHLKSIPLKSSAKNQNKHTYFSLYYLYLSQIYPKFNLLSLYLSHSSTVKIQKIPNASQMHQKCIRNVSQIQPFLPRSQSLKYYNKEAVWLYAELFVGMC